MSEFAINPDIPPVPQACRELLAISSGEAGAADVAAVIASDPRMSLEVIRVSNSAYYARRTPVTIPREAVVTMGVDDALRVALGVSLLGDLLPAASQLALDEVIDYGRVAASAWLPFGEVTATAGMLSAAGLIGMAQYPDRFAAYARDAPEVSGFEELHDLERRTFGLDRCETTTRVAEAWGLPDEIADTLAGWHICHASSSELYEAFIACAPDVESSLLRIVAAN